MMEARISHCIKSTILLSCILLSERSKIVKIGYTFVLLSNKKANNRALYGSDYWLVIGLSVVTPLHLLELRFIRVSVNCRKLDLDVPLKSNDTSRMYGCHRIYDQRGPDQGEADEHNRANRFFKDRYA